MPPPRLRRVTLCAALALSTATLTYAQEALDRAWPEVVRSVRLTCEHSGGSCSGVLAHVAADADQTNALVDESLRALGGVARAGLTNALAAAVDARALPAGGYQTTDGAVAHRRALVEAELVRMRTTWERLTLRGVVADPVLAAALALLAGEAGLIHGPLDREAVPDALTAPPSDAGAMVTISRALRDDAAFLTYPLAEALPRLLANVQLARPPFDRVVEALTCPDLRGRWAGTVTPDRPGGADPEFLDVAIDQAGCELHVQVGREAWQGRFVRPQTGALALEAVADSGSERRVRLAVRRFAGGVADGLHVEVETNTTPGTQRGLLERTDADASQTDREQE